MSTTVVDTTAVETTDVKTSLLRSAIGLQSDGRLVELVRAGSSTAYEAVVQRYRLPLVRYCSRIVGPDHAEDVVQDTFARAHASLMNDDRPMNLKPWLYRIAHNLSLNTLRGKAWNHEELDENIDGVRQPHEHLEQKDRLRDVVARVTALPERQRAALILQAVEGRSSEEIARELDGTVGDVRMLVHRARTRLRDAVGAFIPLPLLLRWLKRGPSSATAASKQAGGLFKAATGSLAKAGAVALTGLAAAGGIVLAERGGPQQKVASNHPATLSATLERAPRKGPAATHRSRPKTGSPAQKRSGNDAGTRAGGESSPTTGGAGGQDHKVDAAEPRRAGSPGHDSGSGKSSPAPGPALQSPSGGGGSTGGGSTGGGSTGGGSTGGGSTGGGSGGGGGGSTGGGLCVGPVAQLPPICLPPLGGGSGGGGLLP